MPLIFSTMKSSFMKWQANTINNYLLLLSFNIFYLNHKEKCVLVSSHAMAVFFSLKYSIFIMYSCIEESYYTILDALKLNHTGEQQRCRLM